MKGTRRTAVVGLGTIGLMALAAPAWAAGALPGPAPGSPAGPETTHAVSLLPAVAAVPEPSPSDDPVTALLPEPVKAVAAPVTRQVVALVLPAPKPTPTAAPAGPATQPVAAPVPAVIAPVAAPVVGPVTASLPRTDLPRADAVEQSDTSQLRLGRETAAAVEQSTGGPRTAPLAAPRPIPPALAVPVTPMSPGLPAAVVAVAMAMVTAAGAGQLAEVRSRRVG